MESVSLSQRVSSSLQAVAASLSRDDAARLAKYVLQTVVAGTSSIDIAPSLADALEAVSTVLLEAARVRATPEQLKQVLASNGVGGASPSAAVLLDLYTQHAETLIAHMEATGIDFPNVVGIDWRLDYSVRSRRAGRKNTALILLCLRVVDRGLPRQIRFYATHEDLQDLLGKVRDAVKQVERVEGAPVEN